MNQPTRIALEQLLVDSTLIELNVLILFSSRSFIMCASAAHVAHTIRYLKKVFRLKYVRFGAKKYVLEVSMDHTRIT